MFHNLNKDKLKLLLNWVVLRGFGQSKAASLTIAMPFVGYAIIYHDKLLPYLGGMGGALNEEDCCLPIVSLMTRLHLVYLGLLFLGVGTLVYRFFAHNVIKSSTDISAYVEKTIPNLTARKMRSMFVTVVSKRPDLKGQFLDRAPWLDRQISLKSASSTFERQDNHALVVDLLRSYYTVLDRETNRVALYISSFAYGLGFVLLAIPSLAFTFRVLCSLF